MKMSNIQVAAGQPGIYVKNLSQLCHLPSKPCSLLMNMNTFSKTSLTLRANRLFDLQCMPLSKSWKSFSACFAGGKGMMENNEGSSWNTLDKAMETFKEQSIEDILRQQIEKGKYYDNGGSGQKPPVGGGGRGGNGSGGSEDGGFSGMLDETLQVVLATIGFIFLYIYIISGQELIMLVRDYIRYLSSGKKSVRLRRFMYKWGQFLKNMAEKMVKDKYRLKSSTVNATT